MRDLPVSIPLGGVELDDATGPGARVDLGAVGGVRALTLIRHRY